MNVLSWFTDLGLQVSIGEGQSLQIGGLDKLKPYHVETVINYAKQSKHLLLVELRAQDRGECDPLAWAMCKHCIHHSVTCVCNGPCTAKGMVRDPECFACHAFVDKDPRKAKRPAYYGRGYEEYLQ